MNKIIEGQSKIKLKELKLLEAGTILKVVEVPYGWTEDDGKHDVVIRTNKDDEDALIVSLKDGVIWGEIDECVFEIITGQININ